MLSDFTPYNGGTWVIPGAFISRVWTLDSLKRAVFTWEPGSHRRKYPDEHPTNWPEEQRQTWTHDSVPATAPAGSVLIFDCRLIHTKAPNESDTPRMCVQVRYGSQWYADACRKNHSGHSNYGEHRNQPLSDEVLEQLPGPVRERFALY